MKKYDLPATFFWPGHSIETFPEQFDLTVNEGFEIGVHGYSHENPLAMTREQEADILDYCIDLITNALVPAQLVMLHRGGSSPTSPTSCSLSAASSMTTL